MTRAGKRGRRGEDALVGGGLISGAARRKKDWLIRWIQIYIQTRIQIHTPLSPHLVAREEEHAEDHEVEHDLHEEADPVVVRVVKLHAHRVQAGVHLQGGQREMGSERGGAQLHAYCVQAGVHL